MVHLVLHFIQKGGLVMIPLLLGVLIALTLVVERIFSLWKYTRDINLIGSVAASISKSDLDEARRQLDGKDSPIVSVLKTGIENLDANQELLDNALKVAFYKEARHLQKYLPTIQILGAIMPMLGLLGTVIGMVHIFAGLSMMGSGDAQAMARGISEALIATQTGLAGAIPIMLLHNFLVSMSDRLLMELKRATVTLHHLAMVRKEATKYV
jgi:biopolymer transport protein ExbB